MRFLALVIATILLASCHATLAADLPNPILTPGAINPELTAEKLCAPGFTTKDYRATTQATKNAVYRAYGMPGPHQGYCTGAEGCEIDHLISLELGGADQKENLWPQSYSSQPWSAHVKDRLENTLHRLVCAHTVTLEEAQTAIRTDWIAAYQKYIGPLP